jgi:two-component system OmpR family sensor kinase
MPGRASRPWRHTLRARLVLRFLAVLAALLLVSAAVQYVVLRGFLLRAAADRLRAGARPAVAEYRRDPDPRFLARAASDPRTVAWVYGVGGALLAEASPPRRPVSVRRPSAAGPPVTEEQGDLVVRIPLGPPAGPPKRGAPGPSRAPAGGSLPGTLVLATPLGDVQAVLGSELRWLAAGGLLALLVAGMAGAVALGRGLRPLERVAATADAVSRGDLSQRAGAEGEPEEVARVGRAFNAMLDRLTAALAEERRRREQMRQFLADASHELRTPLTALLGFLEVLGAGAGRDADTLERTLATAHGQARRMAGLVDRLLALARFEQPAAFRLETLDLRTWLAALWPDLEVAAEGHPLERVEAGPPAGPVPVRADRDALARALLNLVENAAKYSGPGAPVRVSLAAAGGSAALCVADRGPGIAEEDRPHVFERFYRGRAALGGRVAGTGLGLAIVQAVALGHAGRVELTCPPEGGTTATIVLPLSPASVLATKPAGGDRRSAARRQA